MPTDVPSHQSEAGQVHIVDMPGARDLAPLLGALQGAKRRFDNRLTQFATTLLLRHGVALRERDPVTFRRYLDHWRQRYNKIDGPPAAMAADLDAEAVQAGSPSVGAVRSPVPADWFAPRSDGWRGFVFYVHGGSFIAERSPRITALVARFAAAAGARVYSPNYRLAPEHPCPAAIDDIVAAYRWLRREWPDEPVVALAESAGAAILLSAMQQLRDHRDPLPEAMLLLSPWVDLSLQSWSVVAASLSGSSPYTMESLAVMAHLYLAGRPASDPVASPVFGSFRGFPPLLIHASRGDILYDDAVRLAEAVRDARGDLMLRLWQGETHVWERLPGANARRSIELGAEFIRRHLE